jgi:hypothetical protein
MDVPTFPPRNATADEQIVSDPTAFGTCEEALQAFTSRGAGTVVERQYSVSPEWGNVLRARVTLGNGLTSAIPVVCWSKSGQGVAMFVDMQDPER